MIKLSHLHVALALGLSALLGSGACAIRVTDPGDSCVVDGQRFALGDQFPAPDGCNTCTCSEGGQVGCTEMGCVNTCEWNGEVHQSGDEFDAGDGCNTCSCAATGDVACTEIACSTCGSGCSIGCEAGGPNYDPGEKVAAGDHCNTCTCSSAGTFACTKIACACDPDSEFGRKYVGHSPDECAVIDYACPANTTGFGNDCGCGCQQDLFCPPTFDCEPGPQPGCDTAVLSALCPYTVVAL